MVSPEALAANRWYVALSREHKVTPPSVASDGFRQIVDGFKAGRSAMIIHHIGSSNEMIARARRQGLGRAGADAAGQEGLDQLRR